MGVVEEFMRIAMERRHMACNYEAVGSREGLCERCCNTWENHERPHDCHKLVLGEDYNGTDDFARSIELAYELIRERKRNGGPGWQQKEYKPR